MLLAPATTGPPHSLDRASSSSDCMREVTSSVPAFSSIPPLITITLSAFSYRIAAARLSGT